MRIVMVGLPGAGKGTQAAYLAKNLSVPHISTGDMFRMNISQGTELGRRAQDYMQAGQLVPDEITIGMAKSRIDRSDTADGFLLDGFPRNEHQAEALDRLLQDNGVSLDAVLDLQVPQEEAVRRVAGRRLCRTDDSHVFHMTHNAPRTPGLCDLCGGELYQRQDDTEHTVRRRLDVYHRATEPLIAYYRARKLLVRISALGPVPEITQRSMAALRRHSAGDRAAS
ncbi:MULTISPECIES: adenylate kinase [Streptomyces]|uniref:Adenylate kinase n=1 Tax=Streptomyces caniscabiei TaxID=2746961 RepID=A0A927KZ07_9ACTN|nr:MULTISPECIES: adenylate kinase [Streptomyces]MBD9722462.1 adenylate kinase [Streptomyces caniscabiei]MDX3514388.1 adenylate kinase [Streptomyces caniscabiei]MDX3638240.1 adenylate kinase [Streptomyces sp. MB09-02B]MDX3716586.1 adenylate kinase [Streptomyces caniscabiei]MDX3731978.1 adenylate kinase [Streptomyces caniscabiei]